METNHRERQRRNRLLWVLCGATFLIFFQAFMVAPLLPRLAQVFNVPIQTIGLIIRNLAKTCLTHTFPIHWTKTLSGQPISE